MTSLFVARGRTVEVAGVSYGPGALAPIAAEDVERFTALGFVQTVPPILTAPREMNPSGIGLQHNARNVQGPNYSR